MSASAWMKTRSPDSMASQFGAHAWFRKRALLPPRLPSITRPSETPNTNVWPASARWRAAARRQLVSSPVYSISRSPAAMGRSAKSPLPCTDERRAVIRRCCTCEVLLGECPFIAIQKSGAKHIASSSTDSTPHESIAQLTVWRANMQASSAKRPADRKGALRREAVPGQPTRGLPDRRTCGRVASVPLYRGCYCSKGD